jgi:hypothetical protein
LEYKARDRLGTGCHTSKEKETIHQNRNLKDRAQPGVASGGKQNPRYTLQQTEKPVFAMAR